MFRQFDEFDKQMFFSQNYIHAFYCNNNSINYHNHNFFELVYVIAGEARHKHGLDVRTIKKGDYMLMDYSSFHEYNATTADFAVINCLFLSKVIDNTMPDCRNLEELFKSYHLHLNKLVMTDTPVNRFFHDEDGSIGLMLSEMCEECGKKQTGYIDYMRSILIQIIIKTVRNISEISERSFSEQISLVIKHIETNFKEKLRLSDIASDIYISLPYLSLKFKEETGVCFSDYLKQTRIQKACMLLISTNTKIKDIAESVGFGDYKRFGKVFKEQTGVSPKKYRTDAKK